MDKLILFKQNGKDMIKETKVITRTDMISVLLEVEKPTFVHLKTETIVRMNKTGNPYHNEVKKCLSSNFFMCMDYETRVNNNRSKEGMETDFVSSPLSGKEHISKCILTDTKTHTKKYLLVEWFKRSYPKTEFIHNGNSIDRQLFQDYEVKRKESEKQGIENKVNVVTYLIESVKEMRFNGTRYILQD